MWENGYILLRWGFFISLMLTSGVVSTLTLLAKGAFSDYLAQRMRYPLRATRVITLLMASGILLFQHVMMTEAWRQLANGEMWLAVLSTTAGRGWGLQVICALLACVVTRTRILGIVLLTQWSGMSLMGHAAAQEDLLGMVQRLNHVLHVGSAALWIGGLPPLLLVMAQSRRPAWRGDAIATLLRFSRYGHLWVALTVLTGVVSSMLILGWPPISGWYSALLLAKVSLVAVMIALAVLNRYVLVPRLGGEQSDAAQRQLLRNIWLAIGLSALVLLLVSVFATISPYGG